MNRLSFAALALCAGLLAVPGAAQSADPAGRSRGVDSIAISITASQHAGPPFTLRRQTEPRNVVLVNPETTGPQELSQAIHGLLVLDSMDPEGARRDDRRAIRANVSIRVPVYPWAAEVLGRLRQRGHPRPGLRDAPFEAVQLPRLQGSADEPDRRHAP